MTPGRRERREREIFLCYHWWLCLYSRARCERYKTSRADAPKVGDGWRRDQWNMSRWNINSRLSACSCLHSLARTLCFFFFFPRSLSNGGCSLQLSKQSFQGPLRWIGGQWLNGSVGGWVGLELRKSYTPRLWNPKLNIQQNPYWNNVLIQNAGRLI